MNAEIQVYVFFSKSRSRKFAICSAGKCGDRKYRLEVFLKYDLSLISQDLLWVSSFLIGCILYVIR